VRDRIELVEKAHPKISMRKQSQLLGVARSTITYKPVDEDPEDIRIKWLLDEIYMKDPCLGSRRLVTVLERDYDIKTDRKRVVRLRREIGQEAIWCKPRTRIPDDGHRKYPYLLRNLVIERPNQVWCADITYVRMPRGHAYLCAVMDWKSRKVLGWALSNTMGTELCLEALEKALSSTGKIPEIFNTDQGCQFTSAEWTGRLADLGVKISMDGKGRWMDNVFIERLWRSVKYERIYLLEHRTLPA
jgi:putative transposase